MEMNGLINGLREAESGIFQAWLRHIRQAGYEQRHAANRDDFRKAFGGIISVLSACCGQRISFPVFSAEEEPSPAEPNPVAEAFLRRHREPDLEIFLGYFKTLILCIEDAIAGLAVLRPDEKNDALLTLRRIADRSEMSVISNWKKFATAVMPKPLAQTTSEKILSAVFMSVGEGILLIDEDFEIVKANQRSCEIYGLPQQNIIGTDIRSLVEETASGVLMSFFADLIEGQRKSAEITCLYVDGKTFPATVTVTRSDFDGKRYWPMIVRDDTGRKTMETQLRQEKQQTEEMNLTLKTVMKSIEQDRKDYENRVAAKIRTHLIPSLKRIDQATETNIRKSYLALLEEQLVSLTTGFEREIDAGLLKLTKTEIEVCRLIQAGCSSKDICEAMKLSFDTIQTHRKNIRRKLDLNGKKLNLHTYLMNRTL
jgi:PAS domain S-box-containing protein